MRLLSLSRVLLTILGFCLTATLAGAQTGPCPTTTALSVNPTQICFNPSPDHDVVDLNVPRLVEYRIQFYAPGVDPATGQPTSEFSVGKPTPNAQGAIWLSRSELQAIPVGQQYRATGIAVGQQGRTSARSSASNPFGRTSSTPPAAPGAPVVP